MQAYTMTDAKLDNKSEKVSPWVPVSKQAIRALLPVDRPYTELEALLSLQLNHNDGNAVTALGLSKSWGWTRKKVRIFFERVNIEINYPVDTSQLKKQAGHIIPQKGPLKGHKRGHINFIDFNDLQSKRDISGAIKGATIKEKGEKEKKESKDPRVKVFQDWWFEKYKYKFKEDYIVTNWGKFGAQVKIALALPLSFQDIQYLAMRYFMDEDPWLDGHDIGRFLTRLGQNTYALDDDFREQNKDHIVDENGEALKDQ